jgi:hypothetical protein
LSRYHLILPRQAGIFRTVEEGAKLAVARSQRHLLLHELVHLVFHQLLVEQLTRGDPIDLRAKGRNAIFIIMLHAGLPRHGGADQVVAKNEVGGCKQIADHENAGKAEAEGCHPRLYGYVPDLVATGENENMFLRTLAEYAIMLCMRHGESPN